MKRLATVFATIVVICSAAHSQSIGPVAAPKLGYVPDGVTLRPVYGIPAAATATPRIAGLPDLAQVAASPDGNFALVSTHDTGEVSVLKEIVSDTAQAALTLVPGAGIAPDLLLLSPRGKSGVLWFSSLSRAQIFTGFPDHPVWRFFDAVYLDPLPVALAISDDGQWVAGAWSQGVYAFGPNSEVVRMQIAEPGLAIAFAPASHDFVVSTSHALLSIADPGGRASVTPLFTADDGTTLDVIAVAAANQRAIVATRTGQLIIVNTADLSHSIVDCLCQPQALAPMGSASYRLDSLQNGAFRLFDLDQNSVFFVPVGLAEPPDPKPDSASVTDAANAEGAAQ